jgi:hypothetical protein
LALRGQIDDANFDKQVAETQKHLDECKNIDPSRPEAYYNEAILTQEFRAKASGDPKKSIPTLQEAVEKYQAFISKAGGDDRFAEAVKRSEDRVQDIKDTITFIEEGEKARVEQERLDKQMKEEEEARKKEEERLKKEEEERKKAEAEKAKAEAEAKAKEKEAEAKAKADEKEADKKAGDAKAQAASAKKEPAKKEPAKKEPAKKEPAKKKKK